MNRILRLESIKNYGNKIEYLYTYSDELSRYFNADKILSIEYNTDLSEIPESILAIPFVCNVLPVIWITDAKLIVPELDEVFAGCIEDIKNGYKKMYSDMSFNGEIVCGKKIHNKITGNKKLVFFSGGLDATTTLLRHIEDTPDLVTLWGSDIAVDNREGWNNVISHIKQVSDQFGLRYDYIKTNFREFINSDELNKLLSKPNYNWWHEMQHGIGIISHAAPLAYLNGYNELFFASSFNKNQVGQYTCASDPTIDNMLKFSGCLTNHDGYELTRQEKARFIVNKTKKLNQKIKLRVCYEKSWGENCCSCEKCYRTIMEIVSEGGNPNEFGFKWDSNAIRRCNHRMKMIINAPQFAIDCYWRPIRKAFIDNGISDKRYAWFINLDLDRFNYYPVKSIRRLLSKVKHTFIK